MIYKTAHRWRNKPSSTELLPLHPCKLLGEESRVGEVEREGRTGMSWVETLRRNLAGSAEALGAGRALAV